MHSLFTKTFPDFILNKHLDVDLWLHKIIGSYKKIIVPYHLIIHFNVQDIPGDIENSLLWDKIRFSVGKQLETSKQSCILCLKQVFFNAKKHTEILHFLQQILLPQSRWKRWPFLKIKGWKHSKITKFPFSLLMNVLNHVGPDSSPSFLSFEAWNNPPPPFLMTP